MVPPRGRAPFGASLARRLGDRRAVPDLRWVRDLSGASDADVRSSIAALAGRGEWLEAIRRAHRSGGRSFYAQIRAPFELYALARLLRPAHVVETGVSSGVSSAHFLLALSENRYGRLHSIDLPVHQEGPVLRPGESEVSLPPERSPGWAVPAELAKGWDLRIGPAQKLLPRLLRELPKVDLFLHDDLHTPAHLTFELETLRAKLAPGAVALADNTRWTGTAFDRFARSLGVPVRRRRRSDLVGLRVEAVPGGTGPRSAARRRPALRRTF